MHVGANLRSGARRAPYPHLVDSPAKIVVFAPIRPAQVVVLTVADRRETPLVRILPDEHPVGVELHTTPARHRREMIPLPRPQKIGHLDDVQFALGTINKKRHGGHSVVVVQPHRLPVISRAETEKLREVTQVVPPSPALYSGLLQIGEEAAGQFHVVAIAVQLQHAIPGIDRGDE